MKTQIQCVALLLCVWPEAPHAVSQNAYYLEKGLRNGDKSAFDAVEKSKSLDELYGILMLALTRQFKEHSDEVKNVAVAAIRKIPNHAKVLGDRIEQASDQRGTSRKRENAFYLLQNIASDEAILEIGRFLYDERNPDADIATKAGFYIVANSVYAATAMAVATGGERRLGREPGSYGPAEVKFWQDWWKQQPKRKLSHPEIERLVWKHVSRNDPSAYKAWLEELRSAPDIKPELFAMLRQAYEGSKDWEKLWGPINALLERGDLEPHEVEQLISPLQKLETRKSLGQLDRAMVCASLPVLMHYPSPEHERLALYYLNRDDANIQENAASVLAVIGGGASLGPLSELASKLKPPAGTKNRLFETVKTALEQAQRRTEGK